MWIVTIALPAAVAVQLYRRQLWHVTPYHGFFLMLVMGLARDLSLLCYRDPDAYETAWKITLCAMALPHAYAALAAYRHIERRAASPTVVAIALSMAFAALLLPIETVYMDGAQASLRIMLLLYRLVDGSLAVLLLTAASQQFRRTPAHVWLLAAYFASYALVCVIKNQVRSDTPALDTCHVVFVAGLYAAWLWALPAEKPAKLIEAVAE